MLMMHEFKQLIHEAYRNQQQGLKSILATVVFLDGSSYRKPGVRMLISENGQMTGAVSGGCVENEIQRRAQSVFENGKSKIITYDGRFRLGCEGILYILIEPFSVSNEFMQVFQRALKSRQNFVINTYFVAQDEAVGEFGSVVVFDGESTYTFSKSFHPNPSLGVQVLSKRLLPSFKLIILGSEYDAVELCLMASMLGWEVEVITSITDPKQLSDFPGANSVSAKTPEFSDLKIDQETAVVIMTHNYAQDLKYLIQLQQLNSEYIAILGPSKRTERLMNDLLDYIPELSEPFLQTMHSPAGLDIGAITAEEIALSILAEILSVFRDKRVISKDSIKTKGHS